MIPVGIDGTYQAWPRWATKPFRGYTAHVRLGEPLELGAYTDREAREAALPELERVLRKALMELSGECRRAERAEEELDAEVQRSGAETR